MDFYTKIELFFLLFKLAYFHLPTAKWETSPQLSPQLCVLCAVLTTMHSAMSA